MILTTGTAVACSGGNHIDLPITVNGVTRTLSFTRDQLIEAGPDTIEELRPAILARLRTAVLEATTGTPTAVQVRNAISGKTFEV